MAKDAFEFEIKKHLGVLKGSKSGWQREVNIVSWNGASPKLDIREWAPDHQKMGKGVSLSYEELAILTEIIDEVDSDDFDQ